MNWLEIWGINLNLPEGARLLVMGALIIVMIYAWVVFPSGFLFETIERKLSADFQARVGPNQAGFGGWLQPLADGLKLIQKAPRVDASRKARIELLWLVFRTAALFALVAVVPLGSSLILMNVEMSAWLPVWAFLTMSLATVNLGFEQGTTENRRQGFRLASEALAAALPATLSILSVGLSAGGFSWSAIVGAQGAAPFSWLIAYAPPFQILAFLVFMMSGMILLRTGLIEQERAGSLMGWRFWLYYFGRFYGWFCWSQLAVIFFLGAWNLPVAWSEALRETEKYWMLQLFEGFWFQIKTFVLMVLVLWLARSNPRARIDQATDFAWKVLSPAALIALAGAALYCGWGILK